MSKEEKTEAKRLMNVFLKRKKKPVCMIGKVKKAIALYNLEIAAQQASKALDHYIDRLNEAV